MIAFTCGFGLLLTLQVPPPNLGDGPTAAMRREWRAIRDKEAAQLESLAGRLTRQGKSDAAGVVRANLEPKPAKAGEATRFAVLPKVVPARKEGLASSPVRPGESDTWKDELGAIKKESASALFKLAERVVSATPKHYALADACLRGVVHRQPDHPEARRLLGYVPHGGGWATPSAKKRLLDDMVDHPTFGWVDQSWVPHLERGELPAPPKANAPAAGKQEPQWLPAEEADRLHSPWESAWAISTDHFVISTNVPLSEAIAFGRRLEAFHDLFFSLLADLIETDNRLPLAQRFRDKAMVGEKKTDPHQVYYFKNQQEYVDHLRPLDPNIEGSLGIYYPAKRGKKRAPAYSFRDPDGQIDTMSTLYHEVSHQLLFETAGPNGYERNIGNYWVFEGLGTYFETVVENPDGTLEVGGLVGPRIAAAQAFLKEGEFVPIERLLRLSQAEFNDLEARYVHYAESMALAVFLMQARDEAYREPFLDYAKAGYRGLLRRDTGRSLESRVGVSFPELDKEFREFLRGR